jgi:ATP-binding cassette subfamily D (ALD) protein 3
LIVTLGAALRNASSSKKDHPLRNSNDKNQNKPRRERVQVNLAFFKKLWSLLRIMVPGVFTSEFGYMMLVSAAMVARTYCDVWMIKNGTAIERSIISRYFH